MVGAATGRFGAADELIAGFAEQARKAGEANDATHFQASVVQLTDSSLRVFGAENFPGSVLAAVGVDRPAAQRFTDKPYRGDRSRRAPTSPPPTATSSTCRSPRRRPRTARRHCWRATPGAQLSANRDNRVFVVNNEVWQTGQGLIAARGIVDDLRWLNAPIN